MAQTKLGEATVNTNASLPSVGATAPDFVITGADMKDIQLKSFAGRTVVLNIFPSIDTGVCSTSVREFNKRAVSLQDTVVLCVSKDLPFALKRFCGAEGIDKVLTGTDFRNRGFATAYGVELVDGNFAGLCARAVVVVGKDGKVKYTQLVPQIGQEPDYDSAIKAI